MEAPDGAHAALPARVRVRTAPRRSRPARQGTQLPCPDAGIAVPRADARACITRKAEL